MAIDSHSASIHNTHKRTVCVYTFRAYTDVSVYVVCVCVCVCGGRERGGREGGREREGGGRKQERDIGGGERKINSFCPITCSLNKGRSASRVT